MSESARHSYLSWDRDRENMRAGASLGGWRFFFLFFFFFCEATPDPQVSGIFRTFGQNPSNAEIQDLVAKVLFPSKVLFGKIYNTLL